MADLYMGLHTHFLGSEIVKVLNSQEPGKGPYMLIYLWLQIWGNDIRNNPSGSVILDVEKEIAPAVGLPAERVWELLDLIQDIKRTPDGQVTAKVERFGTSLVRFSYPQLIARHKHILEADRLYVEAGRRGGLRSGEVRRNAAKQEPANPPSNPPFEGSLQTPASKRPFEAYNITLHDTTLHDTTCIKTPPLPPNTAAQGVACAPRNISHNDPQILGYLIPLIDKAGFGPPPDDREKLNMQRFIASLIPKHTIDDILAAIQSFPQHYDVLTWPFLRQRLNERLQGKSGFKPSAPNKPKPTPKPKAQQPAPDPHSPEFDIPPEVAARFDAQKTKDPQ